MMLAPKASFFLFIKGDSSPLQNESIIDPERILRFTNYRSE